MFTQIYLGKWDEYFIRLISEPYRSKIKSVKYDCAIDAEDDHENLKLRELKYEKQREMLLKLAEMIDGERVLKPDVITGRRYSETTIEFFFDLRKNLEEEFIPEELVNLLRASILAERKKISCLPNFISFQRVKSEARLKVENFSVCFEDLLLEDELLEVNGNHIVRALLNAALELRENKIIVRNIEPGTLMFNSDFKKCIFGNLKLVLRFNEEDDRECWAPTPYNSIRYHGQKHLPKISHHRDLWAIGIMIFELLIGSEFLKFKTEYNWIRDIYVAVKPYFDPPLQSLFDYLLLNIVEANIECFLKNVLEKQENFIKFNRRRVLFAIDDSHQVGLLHDQYLAAQK